MNLSPLVIVFVTVFIDVLGFGIIIPLLPFYAETFGGGSYYAVAHAMGEYAHVHR